MTLTDQQAEEIETSARALGLKPEHCVMVMSVTDEQWETVDDAIEILHAAATEESVSTALRRVERIGTLPRAEVWARFRDAAGLRDELAGSLHTRLQAMFVEPKLLREIGDAFRDADIVADARDFVADLWWRALYRTDLRMLSCIEIPEVWSDVAATWLEQMRALAPARDPVRHGILNSDLRRRSPSTATWYQYVGTRYLRLLRDMPTSILFGDGVCRKCHRFVFDCWLLGLDHRTKLRVVDVSASLDKIFVHDSLAECNEVRESLAAPRES